MTHYGEQIADDALRTIGQGQSVSTLLATGRSRHRPVPVGGPTARILLRHGTTPSTIIRVSCVFHN